MDKSKHAAAQEALKFVEKGMRIGLGSGSTAEIFISLLGKKNIKEGLGLTCIATSLSSERQAQALGLKLAGFGGLEKIDIAFDGADMVNTEFNLIKGLGGALVREKIVDYRAEKFVVMVGEGKLTDKLSGIVPVEVIPLAEEAVKRDLLACGAIGCETRMDGRKKFITDNSNIILHAKFGGIGFPAELEQRIKCIPGVVDSGIFALKKPIVVVGNEKGSARILR